MKVQQPNGTVPAGTAGRHDAWPVTGLLAVGAWLIVSPLVLHTTRVTAGMVSAVGGGLALVVLAGWAAAARNRVPPLAIAWFLGLWLVAAPSLWEFGDGVDSAPGLVPVGPSDAAEPARALVARAEWSSVLAGLIVLLLAGSTLLAVRRRQGRSAPTTGDEPRRAVGTGRQRR
jgi:SPW repeat